MRTNTAFLSTDVGLNNSTALLNYDYKKLGRDISKAIIECPAILSIMAQRDLSVLTRGNLAAAEIHMKACIRMTCAFIGLKDPYPRKSAPFSDQ